MKNIGRILAMSLALSTIMAFSVMAAETEPGSSASEKPAAETSETASAVGTSKLTGYSTTKGAFAYFKQINDDVKAFIHIPGTNISYPVLQNTKDNDYYLEKDINLKRSKNGVIWADYRNKFSSKEKMSKNTVIYGHNWTNYSATPQIGRKSDVMFAQLTQYHYNSFLQENPYIYLTVNGKNLKYVIFANFYTGIDFDYIQTNPKDAMTIVNGALERSEAITNIEVDEDDKILTLSTCTRRFPVGDKQRFVVMARLLRDGEKIDEYKVTPNKNPLRP